jgi:DNA-binding transcriptional LysR family regulator
MIFSLRQLEQVRIIAETRHFGRAANALSMSQPALTRSIQSLENSLGIKLFDRGGRQGVEPTEFGRLLIDRGHGILRESADLVREIRLRQGLELGELRVEAGYFPAELLVNRAAGRLLARHPRLNVSIRVSNWRDAAAKVLAREAEIAIAEVSEAREDDRLDCRLLADYPFAFACRPGHPLLASKRITEAEFFSYPMVGTLGPTRISAQIGDSFGRAGRRDPETGFFVPAVVVGNFFAAVQVAQQSDAVAASPVAAMLPAPHAGLLRELPYRAPWMVLQYGIITLRQRTLSVATQAFIAELLAIDVELRGSIDGRSG